MAWFIKEVTQYCLRSHSGFNCRYLLSLRKRRWTDHSPLGVDQRKQTGTSYKAVGVSRTPRLVGRGVQKSGHVLFMEKLLSSFKGDIWLCMRASCTRSPKTQLSLPKCGFSDLTYCNIALWRIEPEIHTNEQRLDKLSLNILCFFRSVYWTFILPPLSQQTKCFFTIVKWK